MPNTHVFRSFLLIMIALCALLGLPAQEYHRANSPTQMNLAVATGFDNLHGVLPGQTNPAYLPISDSENQDDQEHSYSGDDSSYEADSPLPPATLAWNDQGIPPRISNDTQTHNTDPVFRLEHPPKSVRT